MTTPREPSQLNAFEVAILDAMTREQPAFDFDVNRLRVRSRRYTGVGSYTDFICDESGESRTLSLKAPVAVPGVPHGMGANLYCRGRQLQCLETFTYGDDDWNGAFAGFSVG